jgi:hypothetical protein
MPRCSGRKRNHGLPATLAVVGSVTHRSRGRRCVPQKTHPCAVLILKHLNLLHFMDDKILQHTVSPGLARSAHYKASLSRFTNHRRAARLLLMACLFRSPNGLRLTRRVMLVVARAALLLNAQNQPVIPNS